MVAIEMDVKLAHILPCFVTSGLSVRQAVELSLFFVNLYP